MAAAAVALLVWISSPSVRAPARVAVAAAIVCALAVVAVAGGRVASPVQRLTQVANPVAQTGGSVQDRLSIVQQAWPRISSDPLVGVGLDTPDSAVTIVSHGYTIPYQLHGLPLAAWYQAGIFGVTGLLGLLGVLAVIGWGGVAAAATDQDALIGFALLAAFIAWVIASMTQPMVFQQYGWISAVFVVAWRMQVRATGDGLVANQPSLRGSSREPAQTLLAA
jgi:O-antigen ligase